MGIVAHLVSRLIGPGPLRDTLGMFPISSRLSFLPRGERLCAVFAIIVLAPSSVVDVAFDVPVELASCGSGNGRRLVPPILPGWNWARPQSNPLLSGQSFCIRQQLLIRVPLEVPGHAELDQLERQVLAIHKDPGKGSAVPVLTGWPDFDLLSEDESCSKLLSPVPKVLTTLRAVDALKADLDLVRDRREDRDGVAVSDAYAFPGEVLAEELRDQERQDQKQRFDHGTNGFIGTARRSV